VPLGTVHIPLTVGELRTLLTHITEHTAPFSRAEALAALNYGYRKSVIAIQSVRPQHFISYVDNFSFGGSQSEFDISDFQPPVLRLVKLIVPTSPASVNARNSRFVLFRYRDFRDPDFEDRETSAAGSFDRIVYEILEGRLPQAPVAAGDQSTSTVDAQVDTDTVDILTPPTAPGIGREVQIFGVGQQRTLEAFPSGEPDYPLDQEYFGRIVGSTDQGGSPNVHRIKVSPRMSASPTVGAAVNIFDSRRLIIAPALQASLTGRLYYLYEPTKFQRDNDVLDPITSKHRDLVVAYAASWLLRSTNDGQAERWFMEAQEMRSELMQDSDPMALEQTEGLSSALAGIGDY
jgi:hypothetical protein